MRHPDPNYVPDPPFQPKVHEKRRSYEVSVSCLCTTYHVVDAYNVAEAENQAIAIAMQDTAAYGLTGEFSDFQIDSCECDDDDERW